MQAPAQGPGPHSQVTQGTTSIRARPKSAHSPQPLGSSQATSPLKGAVTERGGSERDSDLHSSRVLAQLHASSALPEPEARARQWARTDAAERFPGDTGGRSPAVARVGRCADLAAKGTGCEDGGERLDGRCRLSLCSRLRYISAAERHRSWSKARICEAGHPSHAASPAPSFLLTLARTI